MVHQNLFNNIKIARGVLKLLDFSHKDFLNKHFFLCPPVLRIFAQFCRNFALERKHFYLKSEKRINQK